MTQTETLLALAVIAILSSIAGQTVTSVRQSARHQKLTSDLRHLNQAVSLFLANGGVFRNVEDVDAVLLQLKQRRPDSERPVHVGSGKDGVLDPRLSIRTLALADVYSAKERICWRPERFRFELTTEPVEGIEEFWLNENLAEVDFGVDENRNPSVMEYAREDSWIWDYQDRAVDLPEGPTEIILQTPISHTPPGSPPPPTPSPGSGGLAINLGSGTASASDGLALNVLSDEVSAGKGELVLGVLGTEISLFGSDDDGGTGNLAWADPPADAGEGGGLEILAGSGSAAATDGIAATVGDGSTSATSGIAGGAGSGTAAATNGISGNLGSGSSSATNGMGLNVGSGSATAGNSAVP